MEAPAGERDAEVGLEVRAVVPGERGDAIAGPDAEAGEGLRETAGAAGEVVVRAAFDGFIGGAPHDGARAEELLGAPEDGVEGEREVHHEAIHAADCSGNGVPMAAGTRYPSGSIWNRPADDTSSQQRATRPQKVCKGIGIKSAMWLCVLRSVFVERAAEMLGVSRRTVYYRIRQGKLRTVRTRCGTQRVLLDSIEELLREARGQAASG